MKLTRTGMRAWLLSLPPKTVVGHSRRCSDCPLARYLKAQGVAFVAVNRDYYWRGPDEDRAACFTLPQWAERFIDEIDMADGSVTAAQALEALR